MSREGLILKDQHPEKFQAFLDEHYKPPRTRLEKDRDSWFSIGDPEGHEIEYATDSSEVLSLTGTR